MLIWAWGCSDERGNPHFSPASGTLLMALAPAAELITVEFDGTVTVVTDPTGYLNGNVSVGDPVIGLFVYDETVSDEHAKPDVGRYRFSDPSCIVTVNAGLLLFASNSASVDMTIRLTNNKKTNVLKDQFEVKSTSNHDALPGVGVAGINILLVDETATALWSDALADQRPDAVTWLPTRTLVVAGVDGWTVETKIKFITPSDSTFGRRRAREEIRQQ
jgi:hypothetical protein